MILGPSGGMDQHRAPCPSAALTRPPPPAFRRPGAAFHRLGGIQREQGKAGGFGSSDLPPCCRAGTGAGNHQQRHGRRDAGAHRLPWQAAGSRKWATSAYSTPWLPVTNSPSGWDSRFGWLPASVWAMDQSTSPTRASVASSKQSSAMIAAPLAPGCLNRCDALPGQQARQSTSAWAGRFGARDGAAGPPHASAFAGWQAMTGWRSSRCTVRPQRRRDCRTFGSARWPARRQPVASMSPGFGQPDLDGPADGP